MAEYKVHIKYDKLELTSLIFQFIWNNRVAAIPTMNDVMIRHRATTTTPERYLMALENTRFQKEMNEYGEYKSSTRSALVSPSYLYTSSSLDNVTSLQTQQFITQTV